MQSWSKKHEKGTQLCLYIQPGASKNEVSGLHGERLKVKIQAPPRDGEANAGLIDFLSEILKVPKTRIFLIRGESSRQKDILVELSQEKVITLLQELMKSSK